MGSGRQRREGKGVQGESEGGIVMSGGPVHRKRSKEKGRKETKRDILTVAV